MWKITLTLSQCIVLLIFSAMYTSAATIVVDTNDDDILFDCTSSPSCSLRGAVAAANSGDTITFNAPMVIQLTHPTDLYTEGPLVISKNLIINGDLNDDQLPDVEITAAINTRVLNLNDALLVTLKGLKIKNGRIRASLNSKGGAGVNIGSGNLTHIKDCEISYNDSEYGGGGIRNGNGTLFLSNCLFHQNTAEYEGGAITNFGGGTIHISQCTFTENTSIDRGCAIANMADAVVNIVDSSFIRNYYEGPNYVYGAGIYNLGTLTISRSIFQDNYLRSSHIGNGSGEGGALFNTGIASATISDTLFTGNSVRTGGAIVNKGTLEIENSTISGNYARDGSGIYNSTTGYDTGLWIRNCTLVDNNANNGGDGFFVGGLYLELATSINGEHISNSIFGGSGPFTSPNKDCKIITGGLETNIQNLIQDGSCLPALSGDPRLGELSDNGGSTLTCALQPGSPAINAGSNAAVPAAMAYDQRGKGYPRIQNTQVDIGAFEYKRVNFYFLKNKIGGGAVVPLR